jgi:hypothetical protein
VLFRVLDTITREPTCARAGEPPSAATRMRIRTGATVLFMLDGFDVKGLAAS